MFHVCSILYATVPNYDTWYALLQDCELPVSEQFLQQEGSGEPQEICLRKCEPRSYSRIQSSNRESPFHVYSVKSCYGTRHHCLKVYTAVT